MLGIVRLLFQFPALVGVTIPPSSPWTVVFTFSAPLKVREAMVFHIFRKSAYFQLCFVFCMVCMLLWMYGMPLYAIWYERSLDACLNNGKI